MPRDTRANLIFLTIFLGISLPGAVILFKKKLDPTARPMYLPSAPSNTIAYMDPREAPQLKRYSPERTGQWMATTARERGVANVLMRDGLPVMSSGRSFQVVGLSRSGAATVVHLVGWQSLLNVKVLARQAGQTHEGEVVSSSGVALPDEVRDELIRAGFAKPPRQVEWMTLSFAGINPAVPVEIALTSNELSDTATFGGE